MQHYDKTLYRGNDRFISFLSDYGFKATFGNEKDTLFLRKSLQALIGSEIPIAEVFFDKTEFLATTIDGRGGIFDVACIDERGNYFIVEMQLRFFEFFFQRMKFYAFQKLNTMIHKGDYQFDNLTRIYTIGILANTIFEDNDSYRNVGMIRNDFGYVMDNQITYVTIELDKFTLLENEVKTDLEKLIYTMKHFVTYNQEKFEFPTFWTEEWIRKAIHELDRRNFTIEENEVFERFLAQRGAILYAEKKQRQLTEEAKQEAIEAQQEREKAEKDRDIAQIKASKAQQEVNKAQQEVNKAQQEVSKAQQEVNKAQQEVSKAQQEASKAQQEAKEKIDTIIKNCLKSNLPFEMTASIANVPIAYIEQMAKELND